MALINCPECGREISDKANACIHCGCPINNQPIKGKLFIYGYRETFLINPNVKIYMDNNYVGGVSKGGCLELDIENDCTIFARCSIRSVTFDAKKEKTQKIQLSFNKISGKLEFHTIDTAIFGGSTPF